MKTKTTKIIKLIFVIAFFALITNCKKTKKGVIEIKHTTTISSESSTFRVILADDGLYEPNQEFVYKTSPLNYETYTGYYWPDETAKSLGYNFKNKGEDGDVYFTTEKSSDYGGPGENGHWKNYNSSGGSNQCIVGTWVQYTQCGLPQRWYFYANGSGSFSNPDCNGVCEPMVFNFHYTANGSTCDLMYDNPQPMVNCSGTMVQTGNGNNTSFSYTCSSTSLILSGATFTRE